MSGRLNAAATSQPRSVLDGPRPRWLSVRSTPQQGCKGTGSKEQ